ncbi:hypothetical protein [Nonomuraea sp. NPDC049784]|uniref:hypothetical protein n=1 Tax=Nonomuraea sp. NPDC049784 TaxID=3154361 RepID=UPI0033DC0A84
MADHDREAGSRGEEEAPRDPAPAEETEELHQPGAEGRSRLRYGEAPPGPGFAPTMPLASPSRPESYRDFFRQKQAQVLGAGLIGLVLGGLLGGGAVAAVSGLTHRDEMRGGVFWEPGFRHERYLVPAPGAVCDRGPDGIRCDNVAPPAPAAPVAPSFSVAPAPVPTSTG